MKFYQPIVNLKNIIHPQENTTPTPKHTYLPKNCLGGGEIKKQKQDFPSHFCGDCGKHKMPSCGFPNGNFETLPVDWDCGNMRCFVPRKSDMSGFEDKAEEDRL